MSDRTSLPTTDVEDATELVAGAGITRDVLSRVFPTPGGGGEEAWVIEGSLEIGREPGANDVVLDDGMVSRSHACIRRFSPGPFVLVDRDSRNGSFVNGARVSKVVVGDGDVIRIGRTVFVLRSVPSGLAPALPRGCGFVGPSPAFRKAVDSCRLVAGSSGPVLLRGETGTGKEVLASWLHRKSGRRGRFVPVNCAAVSPDLFESLMFGHRKGAFTGAVSDHPGFARTAEGGTLFLDEIGDLPAETQAKMLRFLDSGEVTAVGKAVVERIDVRVVAATNVDLEEAKRLKRFRDDLYARISTFEIRIPPLRERPEDAVALACEAMAHAGCRMNSDAAEAMALHDWPYNAREVLSLVREAAARLCVAGEMTLASLPEALRARVHPRRDERTANAARDAERAEAPSREELERLLRETGGNVSEIARRLDRHRPQIYRWLEKHGLR